MSQQDFLKGLKTLQSKTHRSEPLLASLCAQIQKLDGKTRLNVQYTCLRLDYPPPLDWSEVNRWPLQQMSMVELGQAAYILADFRFFGPPALQVLPAILKELHRRPDPLKAPGIRMTLHFLGLWGGLRPLVCPLYHRLDPQPSQRLHMSFEHLEVRQALRNLFKSKNASLWQTMQDPIQYTPRQPPRPVPEGAFDYANLIIENEVSLGPALTVDLVLTRLP